MMPGSNTIAANSLLIQQPGVLTTCLFWASETLFWFIWQDDIMREIGALIEALHRLLAEIPDGPAFCF